MSARGGSGRIRYLGGGGGDGKVAHAWWIAYGGEMQEVKCVYGGGQGMCSEVGSEIREDIQ